MCTQCEDHDKDRRATLRTLATAVAAAGLPGAAYAAATDWDVRQSPEISVSSVPIPIENIAINGYLARPRGRRARRAVIILHGNPGITDDVANTAAQLALGGFVALAVDWAREGQDFTTLEKPVLGAQQIAHARAGLAYLSDQSFTRGDRHGFVGFCGGGRTAFEAAAQGLPLACIVSFYGAAITRSGGPLPTRDPMELADQINIPVQGHYGTIDEVAPASDAAPLFERLERRQARSEFFAYEGAGHRFYNMTAAPGSDPGFDFVPAAAESAHRRMIRFLRRVMR